MKKSPCSAIGRCAPLFTAAMFSAFLLTSSFVSECRATIITFSANIEFSGGTAPVGAAPWLTAKFDDADSTGSVTLTLTAFNLTASEFISGWYLNLDPSLDVTSLVFSAPTKTGSFSDPGISQGTNAYKADGDGKYDLLLDFATGGGASSRFGVGESVKYTITGISTLNANSFSFDSSPDGGHGPFRMAAHVQSIGDGDDSGWVAPDPAEFGPIVPEPASFSLAAGAAIGLTYFVRRRAR